MSAPSEGFVLLALLMAALVAVHVPLGDSQLLGIYVPMILVLALAGALARQGHALPSLGALPTHRPQFVGLVAAATVIPCALTLLPPFALGPLAEGVH